MGDYQNEGGRIVARGEHIYFYDSEDNQVLDGVIISDKVADVRAQGKGDFAHSISYSGHPVACTAGLATLEVLTSQRIIELVKNKETKERLAPDSACGIACRNQAIKEGLLVLASGRCHGLCATNYL